MVFMTIMAAIVTAIVTAIITMVFAAIPPVTFLVTRNVIAVIPFVLYEINAFAAGVVFVAMPAPMFGIAGRYA